MTITEGNKLIMAYDGWKPQERISLSGKPNYIVWIKFGSVQGQYLVFGRDEPVLEVMDENIEHDIVYHKSWDALMPVYTKAVQHLEKIEKEIDYDNPLHDEIFGVYGIYGNLHKIVDGEIETVWQAVVQFIQWYNKKTK